VDPICGGRSSAIMRRTSAKIPKNGHFRQFEGDVAPMTDDLCADLDQLLLELRQRMSALGLMSRASPVQTARNCMRDEGRPFEVGT
jgi:hypothetical protein